MFDRSAVGVHVKTGRIFFYEGEELGLLAGMKDEIIGPFADSGIQFGRGLADVFKSAESGFCVNRICGHIAIALEMRVAAVEKRVRPRGGGEGCL